MNTAEKGELIKWLRAAIEIGKGDNGVANVFRLVKRGDMGHEEVDSWARPFPEPKVLAAEIENAIKLSSKGDEESTTLYKVLPIYGSNSEPIGAFPIKQENLHIYSSDPETSASFGDASITPKGMLKSNQAHLERVMNMTLKANELQMRNMAQQMAAQHEEVMALRAERERLWLLQQDALDRKQEREIKAAQAVARQQALMEGLKLLATFAPFVIDKIQGKPGADGGELPPDQRLMLEQARLSLRQMDPQLLQQVITSMGPAGIPLAELAAKFRNEQQMDAASMAARVKALVPDVEDPRLPEAEESMPYRRLGE